MKKIKWCSIVVVVLSGCGQPGPLYLPKDQPPVYAKPEPKVEGKNEETAPKAPDAPETIQPKQQQ
jgi:predicted small lipoprotein YifL